MSKIVVGILHVDYFETTGNPGEYTFTDALYQNQADFYGDGVSILEPGFILVIPASDTSNGSMIPGVSHRYKITEVTSRDQNNSLLSGVILWDELGPEVDQPTPGCDVLISSVTDNYQLSYPVSEALYYTLMSGTSDSAMALNQQRIDLIGTDWDKLQNPPTTISGYGITDPIVNSFNGQSGDITLTTSDLVEGSNLYYTQERFDNALEAKTTTDLVEGSSLYYTQERFNQALSAKTTTDLAEGVNKYFTAERHDYATLINKPTFLPTTWTEITDIPTTLAGFGLTDAISSGLIGVANGLATLDSSGKLTSQQIPDMLVGGIVYQGLWNAATNSPTLPAASESNKGNYYIVQASGTTQVDGISDWRATDWIVSDGSIWVKIDNTDTVGSVNGITGTVVLDTDDIAEATSKYFTEARVLDTTLTGLDPTLVGGVSSSDTLINALGKMEHRLLTGIEASVAPALVYQENSRYELVDVPGLEVWIHSSSRAFGNLHWSRTGTTLTINHKNHGHSVGERAILRNTNISYQTALITSVTSDTFSIVSLDSGDATGSLANYSMGFTYVHNSTTQGSLTFGALASPANEELQVISMRIHLAGGSRSSSTYAVTFPASAINGAGADTSQSTVYIPMFNVRQDSDALVGIAATMIMNPASSGYNRFQFGALGAVGTGVYILLQF